MKVPLDRKDIYGSGINLEKFWWSRAHHVFDSGKSTYVIYMCIQQHIYVNKNYLVYL